MVLLRLLVVLAAMLPFSAGQMGCGSASAPATVATNTDVPSLNQPTGAIDMAAGNDDGWRTWGKPVTAQPNAGRINGIVLDALTKQPLAGATVQVRGIQGDVVTDPAGEFIFPVAPENSSAEFYIDFYHLGYVSAYRKIAIMKEQPATIGTIFLTPLDSAIGSIDTNGGSHTNATGTVIVNVPAGAVTAPTSIRATSFVFGEALPGILPTTSFFTYAVEFGPEGQKFAHPVTVRVKNTRGFAAGTKIPVGYFNKTTAEWEHEGTGSITADGQWIEYTVTHFSPRDFNYPTITAPGAVNPSALTPQTSDVAGVGDGQCGGSEIKLATGDLLQTHTLPGYMLFGQSQTLTLTYNSATANPRARVSFLRRKESSNVNAIAPQQIGYRVAIGAHQITGRYAGTSEPTPLRALLPATDARGTPLPTGLYSYAAAITHYYPGAYANAPCFGCGATKSTGVPTGELIPLTSIRGGAIPIINQRSSTVGAGWGFAGIQRLITSPGRSEVLLVDGNGTAVPFLADTITTIAGTGDDTSAGDNNKAINASIHHPSGLAIDQHGTLFIAADHRIRRVGEDGIITTYAGTGTAGYSGDGAEAIKAQFTGATDLAVDTAGNLYIADDGNHVVRRVDTAGIITTIAGTGQPGHTGDGGPATAATLMRPSAVEVAPDGTVYIADPDAHVVRKINADGTITTVAGTGIAGDTGDIGLATKAQLRRPEDMVVDALGNIYIADADAHRIRRVNPAGIITTFAGTGQSGFNGDDLAATEAMLFEPTDLALDRHGNLYVADSYGARIRKISPSGIISSLAGTGADGFSGDGNSAPFAQLRNPSGVAVAPDGSMYIGDADNHRVRRIGTDEYRSPMDSRTVLTTNADGTAQLTALDGARTSFDTRGLMTSQVDRLGHTTTYQYEQEHLTAIIDAAGQVTRLLYDAANHLQSIEDPQHRMTTVRIDANGDLVEITRPDSTRDSYTYNDSHLMTAKKDPQDQVILYAYSPAGAVEHVTFPTGETWTLAGTTTDNALVADAGTEQNPLPAPTSGTTFTDGNGQPWRYQFDARGFMTTATDPLGHTTSYERDATSRPTIITLPSGKTVDHRYDALGQLTYLRKGAGNEAWELRQEHDDAGHTTKLSIQDLDFTFAYDAHGNRTALANGNNETTHYTYNVDGLPMTMTSPMGHVTTFQYDAFGRATNIADELGVLSTITYDNAGNVSTTADGAGHMRSFTYDAMNRLAQQVDANGGITDLSYESPGCGCSSSEKITELSDPSGHRWHFTYNPFGQLTASTDPLGAEETRTYDAARRLSTIHTRTDDTITFAYDAAGQLTQRTAGGDSTNFTYDADGNLLAAGNEARSHNIAYDAAARPETITQTGTGPALTLDYSWGHSAQPNRISGLPASINFFTDYSGRRTSVSSSFANAGIFYDADGRLDKFCYACGSSEPQYFSYDARGRLTQTKNYTGTLAINYAYDASDNIVQRIEGSTPRVFGYDPSNQLTAATNGAENYTYDSVGNRLIGPTDTSYEYDAANRPKNTFTSDAAGRMTSQTRDGITTAYTWNAFDQLVRVQRPDTTVDFTYDPFGRRAEKTVTQADVTTTQRYIYDGPNRIADYDGNNQIQAQYFFADLDTPAFERRNGQTRWFYTDGHHNIVRVRGTDKNSITTYRYDSFGNVVGTTGPTPWNQPFLFTSREWDPEIGLYYYRARYYDPQLGRFLTEDPIGFAGGDTNLYRYAGNNPINRMDPWGLASCTYSISAHTLVCTPNGGGTPSLLGPSGVWSGVGGCANNMSCENIPNLGPIVPGKYNMNQDLRAGHEGFWRLEPNPKIPGWKCRLGIERCGFELHPGGTSLGCITADKNNSNAMQQYGGVNSLLNREIGTNVLGVVP